MKFLRHIRDWATIAMFVVLFLTLVAGIVSRYVLHAPIAWTDELAVILFIWVIFFTGGFSLPYKEHFGFDVVYDMLSLRSKRVISIVTSAGLAAVLIYSLPFVWDYISFMWRERTAALQWRYDYVYMIFPIFQVAVVLGLLRRLVRLLSPKYWEAEI
ncbi:TRAP transporter small permease [Celeribacter persicus]|uniref:TRAP transporter small permease protein n=1 Tax=Celeribacter persicus TaxID=1651082 RepID=A0A2T5H0J1_9RHOB|nr:TRAP transporter small permease [Celeribacter persicus]PTQ65077.1 TRAP-type C4-dicarboxylate transport system permease small subunit [Celeribacter persicus]